MDGIIYSSDGSLIPSHVEEGTLCSDCLPGLDMGIKEHQRWLSFSHRVLSIEKEWGEELQILSSEWQHSRGYFHPDEKIVGDRILRLRKISSGLANLVEDLESNIAASKASKISFFISYSHTDKDFVLHLATDLRRKGYDVWRDEEEIRIGESIRQRIESGIEHSTFIVICLSKYSVNSSWVNDEIDMAVTLEKEYNRVVLLPIVLEECDIPILLKGRRWVNFENYQKAIMEFISNLPISK